MLAGTLAGVAAGLVIGVLNGLVIVKLRILPFIATLAMMLAAYGSALVLAQDQSVSVSYDSGFTDLGQGDIFNFPIPALIAAIAYVIGSVVLNFTSAGRTVLAIGGNEDASRLMGLPVDRVKFFTYVVSGGLAGLAGVILAAQFGAGQPTEGVGWELVAIASVVVGGTLLTGGLGSVGATLAGVMLLGLIFNVAYEFREWPRIHFAVSLTGSPLSAARLPAGGRDHAVATHRPRRSRRRVGTPSPALAGEGWGEGR